MRCFSLRGGRRGAGVVLVRWNNGVLGGDALDRQLALDPLHQPPQDAAGADLVARLDAVAVDHVVSGDIFEAELYRLSLGVLPHDLRRRAPEHNLRKGRFVPVDAEVTGEIDLASLLLGESDYSFDARL